MTPTAENSGGVPSKTVEVAVTNHGARTVRLPKWQLPDALRGSEVFRVTRDGKAVPYEGYLVKRAVPNASEFAIIRPGQTLRSIVDLSVSYDMTIPGDYTVAYATALQYASLSGRGQLKTSWGGSMELQSAPARAVSTGGTQVPLPDARGARNAATGGLTLPGRTRSVTFTGDYSCITRGGCNAPVQATYVACSDPRINDARQAIAAARVYSENSKNYLNAAANGDRYTWWFGTFLAARYDAARQNFARIDAAMDINDGRITIRCDCDPEYADAYAYVYPNDPYKIYVCNAFWAAPMTGTDSKAGTLIHEMSHFTVVADTNDWVYGQTGAHNLALNNPDRTSGNYALSPPVPGNADSHEYFAENTPTRN